MTVNIQRKKSETTKRSHVIIPRLITNVTETFETAIETNLCHITIRDQFSHSFELHIEL